MKICTQCKIEKPLDLFQKDKRLRSGISSWCKQCVAITQRQWKRTKVGRTSYMKANKKSNDKTPARLKAYTKVRYALERGDLIKEPCEVCADPKSQAHHEDYSKPFDVIWLCQEHHTAIHKGEILSLFWKGLIVGVRVR